MNIVKALQNVLREPRLIKALLSRTLLQYETFVSGLDLPTLYRIAALVLPSVELHPYPGWHFGIAEDNPKDKLTLLRIAIWRCCREHHLEQFIVMPWYNNLRIYAYLGNDISRLLFIDGNYDPNEFVFLASILKPNTVFLDIGANDGLYSLFAAQYLSNGGYVLAFEPSKREFDRLQANIKLNNISNIKPYRLALYNTNENKAFQIADYEHEGQNTLGDFIYEGVHQARVENITVRRLDDLALEEHWDRIDVIKMDVEGAEYAVLEGARHILQSQKPVVLLELSDSALKKQGSSAAETLEFLRSLGYSIHGFSETNGMLCTAAGTTNLSPNIVASSTQLEDCDCDS